jgi:hypothetical protein
MQPCGWNCPRAEGHGSQKIVCFAYKILVFHFFSLFFFAHGSARMDGSALWSKCKVYLFFSRIFTRSIVLKFGIKTPSTEIILAHSYLQI